MAKSQALGEFGGFVLNDRCPCCSTQGVIALVVCTECGCFSGVCDEVGTVFHRPPDTSEEMVVYGGISAHLSCRDCGCDYNLFKPATQKEILAAGIDSDQIRFMDGIPDPREQLKQYTK